MLDTQVKRMLADPQSRTLSSRFAARVAAIAGRRGREHFDAFWFPDYDQQLSDAMQTERSSSSLSIVRKIAACSGLAAANYTFREIERLARRHCSLFKCRGQRVPSGVVRGFQRGVARTGSILVQTSLANRTSPVLRGKCG
jgi:hypothetical protein